MSTQAEQNQELAVLISEKDLRLLVWCAMNHDRRLPHGEVPHQIWESLSPQSRAELNQHRGTRIDDMGAEVKP